MASVRIIWAGPGAGYCVRDILKEADADYLGLKLADLVARGEAEWVSPPIEAKPKKGK